MIYELIFYSFISLNHSSSHADKKNISRTESTGLENLQINTNKFRPSNTSEDDSNNEEYSDYSSSFFESSYYNYYSSVVYDSDQED